MFQNLRRFVVLQFMLAWQGGFLFYSAVVVPAGTEVLGSAAAQGAITARVTDALNVLSLGALAMLAFDLRVTRDPNHRRTTLRWWCWTLAMLCQGLLFYFHLLLDAFMDGDRNRVVIGPAFLVVHKFYLWTVSLQWLVCLLLVWLLVPAWRAEDRRNRG